MDEFTAAIQEAADNYGRKRLAADLGMTYGCLCNQINPATDGTISLSKFYQMVRITRDARLLDALHDELGLVATPRIDAEDEVEAEIQEMLLDQQEQASRFMHAIRQAKADGRIDATELELIRNERRALAENGNTIMTRIEKMHEKGLRLAKA